MGILDAPGYSKTDTDKRFAPNSSMYVVGDGDSITQASVDSIARIFADSWYTYFTVFSDGRVPYVYNAGHGGYSSAQLVALLDSEVLPNLPSNGGVLVWAAGRNDSQNIENTKAADRSVLAWCRTNRVQLIVTTLPPVGSSGIATPAAPTGVADTTSGTLAAATYAYRIVAKSGNDATVTLPGPVTNVVVSATGRVVLTWPRVPGSTGYDIYRDGLRIGSSAKMSNPTHPYPTFTDTGFTGSGSVPSSNTTPAAAATADILFTSKVNAWRKRFALTNGLQCIDFYRVLTDPTTGRYKLGFTFDGTHPSSIGQKTMGQEAWDTLMNHLPQVRGYIAEDQADPLNAYTNGLFLTGAGSPVDRPSPFNGYSTPAVLTGSIGAVTGFKGNGWTLDRTDASKGAYNGAVVATLASLSASVGDLVQFSAKVQMTGSETGGMVAEVGVKFEGITPSVYLGFWRLTQDIVDPTQLVSPVIAIPATATGLRYVINVFGGTGKLVLGQWTVVNLTTASIADASA